MRADAVLFCKLGGKELRNPSFQMTAVQPWAMGAVVSVCSGTCRPLI